MRSSALALSIAASCMILLVIQAGAHPTYYPHLSSSSLCNETTPSKIYSYHIHLLYWHNSEDSSNGSYAIRNAFVEKFNDKLDDKICPDQFHSDVNCMGEINDDPFGPFVVANWFVYILPENLSEMMEWFIQHRGKYSIFLHPNSGCLTHDHVKWSMWGG